MSKIKITKCFVDPITFVERVNFDFLPNLEDFVLDETIAGSMSCRRPRRSVRPVRYQQSQLTGPSTVSRPHEISPSPTSSSEPTKPEQSKPDAKQPTRWRPSPDNSTKPIPQGSPSQLKKSSRFAWPPSNSSSSSLSLEPAQPEQIKPEVKQQTRWRTSLDNSTKPIPQGSPTTSPSQLKKSSRFAWPPSNSSSSLSLEATQSEQPKPEVKQQTRWRTSLDNSTKPIPQGNPTTSPSQLKRPSKYSWPPSNSSSTSLSLEPRKPEQTKPEVTQPSRWHPSPESSTKPTPHGLPITRTSVSPPAILNDSVQNSEIDREDSATSISRKFPETKGGRFSTSEGPTNPFSGEGRTERQHQVSATAQSPPESPKKAPSVRSPAGKTSRVPTEIVLDFFKKTKQLSKPDSTSSPVSENPLRRVSASLAGRLTGKSPRPTSPQEESPRRSKTAIATKQILNAIGDLDLDATESVTSDNSAIESLAEQSLELAEVVKKVENLAVRFSDDVAVHEISRLRNSILDDIFYGSEELATFRYEAFMEEAGLNIEDYE